MGKITVDGCEIEVAFNNYEEFKSNVLAELDKLGSVERLALDGTPTTDASLFGSRQVVMYHIIHMIRRFEKNNQKLELPEFYGFVCYLAFNYNKISHSAKTVHKMLISDFDSAIDKLKNNVYASENMAEQVTKKDWTELSETLLYARKQTELAYDSYINGRCAEIAIKFCELGTDFYGELAKFDNSFIDEAKNMNEETVRRRKELQELHRT